MKNYQCCFVESSDASNLNWNTSYICDMITIPVVGDIIDFKEYSNEEEFDSLKNEKEVPLREIVGAGRVVSCCFMSVSQKTIL